MIKPKKSHGPSALSSYSNTSNLTISQPGDPAELEADRVADQVVHASATPVSNSETSPVIQMEPATFSPLSAHETISSQEDQAVELEEKPQSPKGLKQLQLKKIAAAASGTGSDADPELGSKINSFSGKGSPLPERDQKFL